VNFGHYAHPEFGYLSPAPRFRRELRVAFFAALFGAAIGVVSVIALSASDGQGNLAAATQARATAPVSEPREGDAGVTASGFNSADTASNHQVRSSPGFVGRSVGSEKFEANRATACEDHLSLDSQRQCSAEKLHRARLRAAGNGPDVARVPLGHPAPVENATPSPALADSVSNPSDVSTPSSVAQHKIARAQNRRHKEASERVAGVTLGMDNGFGGFGRAYARDPVYPRTGFWDWSR